MSNILLNKKSYAIKNSHTEKNLPFLYKGDRSPSEIRISETEIPSMYAGSSLSKAELDRIPGYAHTPYVGGVDDWGNPLSREDFTGNHLQVEGMELLSSIDSRSEDLPSEETWNDLTMAASGTSMVISNYSATQTISNVSRRVLYPWKSSWTGETTVSKQEGAGYNLTVSRPSAITDVLIGKITIEPTERNWTRASNTQYKTTVVPEYNYPYSSGVYDLKVTSNNSPALYKILNKSYSGLERKWVYSPSSGRSRAVYWDASNYRWQITECSSVDATNNTITPYGDPIHTQYLIPSNSFLYGSCQYNTKGATAESVSMSFSSCGTSVLVCKGTSPIGSWTDLSGKSMGFAEANEEETEITISKTYYRELSKNAISYLGNWTNGVQVVESGNDLIVSGFDKQEVNGTYTRFIYDSSYPLGTIWLLSGSESKYSISYDAYGGYWKLCTTVDGVYELKEESPQTTGVFRVWENKVTIGEATQFTNVICFNRYKNSWEIKNTKNLSLDLGVSGSTQSSSKSEEQGDSVVWTDGTYSLRYSKQDYCWKLYDVAGNIVSIQTITPTSWIDNNPLTDWENTVVDWANYTIIMEGAPFAGVYTPETFSSSIHPFSMSKDVDIKTYFLTYDTSASIWKLVAKLNMDGDYSLKHFYQYLLTEDTVFLSYKQYYTLNSGTGKYLSTELVGGTIPANTYYEKSGEQYSLTEDSTFQNGKSYYVYDSESEAYLLITLITISSAISPNTFYEKIYTEMKDRVWEKDEKQYILTQDLFFLAGKDYYIVGIDAGEVHYVKVDVVVGEAVTPGVYYEQAFYLISYSEALESWVLKDTFGDSHCMGEIGEALPDPVEGIWSIVKVWESGSEDLALCNFEDWVDATGIYPLVYTRTQDVSYVSGKEYYRLQGGAYVLVTGWTAGDPIQETLYEKPSGTNRTWSRTGTDGKYTVEWDSENVRWRLVFLNTAINGSYPKTSDRVWSKTIGTSIYSINWDSTLKRWQFVKGADFLIGFSITTSYARISTGWSEISIVLSDTGTIATVSGASKSEANGNYSLLEDPARSSDLDRKWTKLSSDESSLFTIKYDFAVLKWVLQESNLDSNGSYDFRNGTGISRKWRREGKKIDTDGNVIAYLVDWDASQTRWRIRRENNYLHTQDVSAQDGKDYYVYISAASVYGKLVKGTNYSVGDVSATGSVVISGTSYPIGTVAISDWFEKVPDLSYQTTQGEEEPYEGTWTVGTVIDPFSNSALYHVGVRYIPQEKQEYYFIVSGNNRTEENRKRYNSIYHLMDSTKTGKERVWKSTSGVYILWVEANKAWAITSNPNLSSLGDGRYRSDDVVCAYSPSDDSYAEVKDLSTISNWTTNYYTFDGTFSLVSHPEEEYGKNKPFWMIAIYSETVGTSTIYRTSNIETYKLSVQVDDISNVSLNLLGSSGNADYTGFWKDSEGNYIPTDLITVKLSAYSLNTIRVGVSGVYIPGLDLETDYSHSGEGVISRVGILNKTTLGDTDTTFDIVLTVLDEAGNSRSITKSITHISRLWRMEDTNIKEDSSGYQTKVYSESSTGGLVIIPKTTIKDDSENPERSWQDIFYPVTHGYPVNDDGTINKKEAIRISQPTEDPEGKTGPTSEELKNYDRLTLSSDGMDLSTDTDGRYITSGWDRSKTYLRMESSSYGIHGENLKYWIVDNSGYSDFQLEFEYFDLSSQVSSVPKNNLSPYEGDVLVIYDASAEGCIGETVDEYGNKKKVLEDSSKLVELYAFTGSHYDESISMKSDSQATFDLKDFGFVTPKITTTSKLCMILYTDNDYQLSGFKLKAGPAHSTSLYNYEIKHSTGEIWIHQSPGTASSVWYSPSKVKTTHQYTTANSDVNYERSRVTFDSDPGTNSITGDFYAYAYLKNHHDLIEDEWVSSCETPESVYRLQTGASTWSYSNLLSFMLYNDDCVDYYEVSTCVVPSGVEPDYTHIYEWNGATNYGKIVSNITYNKDKGIVTFLSAAPLGRMFSSYSYHSYYRLTNDGYGDLNFYENSLIPSSDYSITGLKDWTYVDLMVYNEGSIALAEGLMKFLSRGYISGSGTSQTITQVVDENRPWDVQSGTVAETVNQTGASFSSSYTGLADKTRAAAISAISSSSGGVSLGSSLAARSKAYLRIYWCLAKSVSGSTVTYVTTTRGKKLWSSEISGKYFVVTV